MRGIFVFILLFSQLAYSGSLYQCKDEEGKMSFQDRPCEGEAIKVSESKKDFDNSQFKEEMIKTLAKMTGKSEQDLKDPKIRKAAEILAATDASKSYAFTKIYGVSAKFCGDSVAYDLDNYNSKAADIIALGRWYYTNGINVEIKGENLSKSGKELTEGLNGMLRKLESEHESATPAELKRKCKEASKALKSLTFFYSS